MKRTRKMIKLKGKYGIIDAIKVDITFENGRFDLVKNDDKTENITFPIRPKDHEIISTNDEFGLPKSHKYAIKYIDQFKKEQYVFVDIKDSDIRKIKWQKRQYWIQRKEFMIGFILSVFTIVGTTLLTNNYQTRNPKNVPRSADKNITKQYTATTPTSVDEIKDTMRLNQDTINY